MFRIEVGYATGVFERRAGDLYGSIGAVIAGTAPQSTRFAAILGAEGNRWIVTLAGCLRDYPPTDFSGWKAFAGSLPTSTRSIWSRTASRSGRSRAIDSRPTGVATTKSSQTFPAAISSPATPSAASTRSTDRACPWHFRKRTPSIAASPPAMAILATRFFREAAQIVESPWAIATGEDYRYPQVEGRRPPGFGIVSRYMARAHRVATRDPVVLKRFFRVASLLAPPPAMMAPAIAWRVLLGGGDARETSPARKVYV